MQTGDHAIYYLHVTCFYVRARLGLFEHEWARENIHGTAKKP